jgi:hypothetical protein
MAIGVYSVIDNKMIREQFFVIAMKVRKTIIVNASLGRATKS